MPVKMTTRKGVAIARTGSYLLSTGPATFTEEDLAAAVRAFEQDPAVHAPRIKVDGLGESFDPEAHGGEPALGWAENLRVSANGQELLADLVMPEWLDEVADFAYPNRSIEGAVHAQTPSGQKHELVVTAVALLGVDLPGISTLDDLREMLTGGEPVEAAREPQAILAASGWSGEPIRAGMDQEIVRRRFYDTTESGDPELPDGVIPWDLWVVAIRFDDGGKPYIKAVDEASGRLYRFDFSISGNDVTFSAPSEVMEQDVPVAAQRPRTVVAFYSRAESRPNDNMEDSMTPEQIRKLRDRLGLAEDQLPDNATAEQIDAALETPAPTPEPEPTPIPEPTPEGEPAPEGEPEPAAIAAARGKVPEGMQLIDAETLAQLKAGAEAGTALKAQAERQERDDTIRAAIHAGKIAPASRERWQRKWDADAEEARHLLTAKEADGGLAQVLPVGAPIGGEPQDDAGADDNQGTGLIPGLETQEA